MITNASKYEAAFRKGTSIESEGSYERLALKTPMLFTQRLQLAACAVLIFVASALLIDLLLVQREVRCLLLLSRQAAVVYSR